MPITIPGSCAPSNLHLSPEVRVSTMIDGDMYEICKRIEEVSDRLFIIDLQHDDKHTYAIMERCDDGVERLVYKVKELDGRVITKLQKMMKKTLSERYEALEREEHRLNEQAREDELDRLYEEVGAPMLTELEKCGFIQRGISYPKLGVASPGRAR